MNDEEMFWMVYVEGEKSPVKKHRNQDDAFDEAKRLSSLEGKPVYVLRAIGGYKIIPNPNPVRFNIGPKYAVAEQQIRGKVSEKKAIVIEKLCVFCEHFKWSASESTGCDTCGPTHEHAECKAEVPQFDYEIPDDAGDFRALILNATNCQYYSRNGTAK